MPKLPFDLTGFVKVDANRDHTVFQSPEGHLIHVSNKAIAKDLHDAMRKLPVQKLSQGGTVKKPLPGSEEERKKIQDSFNRALGVKKMKDGGVVGQHGEDAHELSAEELRAAKYEMQHPVVTGVKNAVGAAGQAVGEFAGESVKGLASVSPLASAIKASQPAQLSPKEQQAFGAAPAELMPAVPPAQGDMQQMGAMPEEPMGLTPAEENVKKYGDAVLGMAESQGQQAKDEVNILDKQAADQEHMMKAFDNIQRAKLQAYDDYAKFIANPENAVEPQRLMANQSTWGKIGTAIGLGIGGAPAMSFLQKQIDEDIKQQQKRIDDKSTLYAQNLKLLGDSEAALNQTQVMMNQLAQNQIMKVSKMYTAPQAKLAAEKMLQEFTAQNMEKIQKGAALQAQQRMLGAEAAPKDKYRQQIRAAELIDPKRADDLRGRLTPVGFADTADDAKEVKALIGDSNVARSSLKRLQDIGNTTGSSITPSLRTEAESLVTTLVASLNKPVTGGGPMTETERKLVTNLARNPTAIFSLSVNNRAALDTLSKFINKREAEALKARGLEPQVQDSFTPRSK